MIRSLEIYNPSGEKNKTQKTSTLLNAKELYKGRRIIIIAFENGTFPLPRQYPSGIDNWKEDEMDLLEFLPDEKESSISLPSFQHKKWEGDCIFPNNNENKFDKLIVKKYRSINKELFKKHFKFRSLVDMQKNVYRTKYSNRNKDLVDSIKSGLFDLGNEIG